jgi:hypothetical protein
VPESIRNAIILALIAVLVAVMGVGLLAWTRRPASPPRPVKTLSLLVNDRDGGVYDLSVKVRQVERRLGESQLLSFRLMQQLKESGEERDRLTNRLTVLEKEVRSLRRRVQDAEQRLPSRVKETQPAAPVSPVTPAAPSAEPTTTSGTAPAGTTP